MGKGKKLVYGVGDTGGLTVTVNGKKIKAYNTWKCMLERCYSESRLERHPSYIGCEVSEEWKYYPNFLKFYEDNYREGYQLDKDLLIQNNKIYSKETCRFVPQTINLLILQRTADRGQLPIGVNYKRGSKRPYQVRIRVLGKSKYIGIFSTPEEAFYAYKEFKEAHVKEVAEGFYKRGEICEAVYNALMKWEVNIDD